MSKPGKDAKLDKSRGIHLSIPQDWADMMAVCRHSSVDALNVTAATPCGKTVRTMGPFYLCSQSDRQGQGHGGRDPLCRLMLVAGSCDRLDPWAGHEDLPFDSEGK